MKPGSALSVIWINDRKPVSAFCQGQVCLLQTLAKYLKTSKHDASEAKLAFLSLLQILLLPHSFPLLCGIVDKVTEVCEPVIDCLVDGSDLS